MDANRVAQTYSSNGKPSLIQRQELRFRSNAPDAFSGLSGVDMYPAPFVIKNTFINCQVTRDPSFDDFYQERAAHSCPNSKLSAQGVSADEDKFTVTPISSHVSGMSSPVRWTTNCGFDDGLLFEGQVSFRNTFVHFPVDRPSSLEAFINDRHARSCPSSGVWLQECEMNADDSGTFTADHHALPREPVQLPVVLSLADSVPEPALDLVDFSNLPSVGSAGHHLGTCKPCAFTIKGCASGAACSYCHLCDPTEKKRRRKEKATLLRGLRNLKKMDPRWILGA